MGIDLYINDWHKWEQEDYSNRVDVDVLSCQCVDHSEDGEPYPECYHCKGAGSIMIEDHRFTMRLNWGFMDMLLSGIGKKMDDCGEIDPAILLKQVKSFIPGLLVKESSVSKEEGKCTVIDCGISPEYETACVNVMVEICEEAINRGKSLYWC